MNEQELNKKLAEWAGLSLGKEPCGTGFYLFGDAEGICHNANFTQSLDACFKWLVPENTTIQFQQHDDKLDCVIYYTSEWYTGKAGKKEFALAFCLALEEFIDG